MRRGVLWHSTELNTKDLDSDWGKPIRHPSCIRLKHFCGVTCQMKILHPGTAMSVRKNVRKRIDVNSSGLTDLVFFVVLKDVLRVRIRSSDAICTQAR